MLRLSIIAFVLLLVSGIGFTFGSFEPMAYRLYNSLSILGINPSFTPITFDMSMMTSLDGKNNFANPIDFFVQNERGEEILIAPETMNLYRHKIPIILFLEQAQEGVDLIEARYGICQQMSRLLGQEVSSFMLKSTASTSNAIFQRKYVCDFS